MCSGDTIHVAQLQCARRLAAESDLPLQSEAIHAGVEGYRQLVRVFSRAFNITPTAYRGQMSGLW